MKLEDLRSEDIALAGCIIIDFCHDMCAILHQGNGMTEWEINAYEGRVLNTLFTELNRRSAAAAEAKSMSRQLPGKELR